MLIQVNTDPNIEGHEQRTRWVTDTLENELDRFRSRITRLEVHLSDENSNKQDGGSDKRCLIEARLEGKPPIAVSHRADRLELAVDGAVAKLLRMIDSTLEKTRDKRKSAGKVSPELQEPPEEL